MFKRKSIVLSDVENKTNQKAVLSMEEDDLGIKGSVRLYNFSAEPNGVCSLGFFINNQIIKAGLTKKSSMLYDFFLDQKEIPSQFSCAVVNFQNAVATPILYGASDGKDDEIYGEIISQMTQDSSRQNVEKVLDNYGVDYDEQEKQQIEKDIDDAMCEECKNCENCVYKKYFYENQQPQKIETAAVTKLEEVEDEKKQEDNEIVGFVEKLKPQIDKLFETNPAEENLQSLIPSSKWVKIEYEDDGDFYVFGLLYDEDGDIKYVCYGVPAVFEEEPPKELSGYPIWLPLDKQNDKGFGYWLTYQDAITGEPIKAILQ